MSEEIEDLKSWKLETEDMVNTLNKFQMPYHISNDQLLVEQSYQFSSELIQYTRQCLRIAFHQKKSLFEVSCRIVR